MSEITLNLDEILKDPEFTKQLGFQIKEINRRRSDAQRGGAKLKRSPYDHLQEAQLLNTIGLIAEFNLMREKKSKLPSSVRGFIEVIFHYALKAYLEAKQETQAKEHPKPHPKPKSKPKAKKSAIIE